MRVLLVAYLVVIAAVFVALLWLLATQGPHLQSLVGRIA